MLRQLSPQPMLLSLYDLDQPPNQTKRSFKTQANTIILDIKNYIKQQLDDNYEVLLYFENDKQFEGNPNAYVFNLIKHLQTREIRYKKVLIQKSTLNQIQNQSYDHNYYNNINNNNNNNSNYDLQSQSEYLNKSIKIQLQQEQNKTNKINTSSRFSMMQDIDPNLIKNNDNNQKFKFLDVKDIIKKFHVQPKEFANQYSQQLVQSQLQNQYSQNQQQLQSQELQQLKQEKQQVDQQNYELQNQISKIKAQLLEYENLIRQQQIDNQKLDKEIKDLKQSNQQNYNKFQEEYQKLKNENKNLQNELQETKFKSLQQIQSLNKEKDISKYSNCYNNNPFQQIQEENQKLKNEIKNLQNELQETKIKSQKQIEAKEKIEYQNEEQKQQILKLNSQNKQLEQQLQENFNKFFDVVNIQMKKIQDMWMGNHDCLSKLTFIEIQDLLEHALSMQKQVHCNCLKEQFLPLNKFKKLHIILDLYQNMIHKKQLSTLIRIQRNGSLPIYKCCSNNCNFIFIYKNDKENQEIEKEQQFYCQNCELFCQVLRL